MRVKARQSMYYGRRMRAIDEVYEMDDREESEAKILAALGKIEILPAEEVKQQHHAAAIKAEDPPSLPEPMTTETSVIEPRRYRRRDMRSEQ